MTTITIESTPKMDRTSFANFDDLFAYMREHDRYVEYADEELSQKIYEAKEQIKNGDYVVWSKESKG